MRSISLLSKLQSVSYNKTFTEVASFLVVHVSIRASHFSLDYLSTSNVEELLLSVPTFVDKGAESDRILTSLEKRMWYRLRIQVPIYGRKTP